MEDMPANPHENPWFSPIWYLSAYPDIRVSGVDPWQHYRELGWREGRDPSGLFSTNWYLANNLDVAAAGLNPLEHYVKFGRAEGRCPHPALGPVDHTSPRIALVVVSYNATDVIDVLLASLAAAHNRVRSSVFLVENGSDIAAKAVVSELAWRYRDLLDIRYIDHPENLGFSGGNNLGIRAAWAEDFTHICLLNSDVVCTTSWLDRLLATGAPVVSPVSNAVGNEQTVAIDYSIHPSMAALELADTFARRRAEAFMPILAKTDFLGFFCVMLERSVIDRVGLLDEQFFPGSYEDDDYCIRMIEAGYDLQIARHVYLHHFGSASFSTLGLDDRIALGDENRRRFEAKWGRTWSDRTHLPAMSGMQDAARYISNNEHDALLAIMLGQQASQYSRLTKELMAAIRHYRDGLAERDNRILQLSSGVEAPLSLPMLQDVPHPRRVTWGGASVPLASETPSSVGEIYTDLLYEAWSALEEREFISFDVLTGLQPFIHAIASLFEHTPPLLVLTQADPVTSDEKDGYVQRVRAVDAILAGRARIYVHFEERNRSKPVFTELGEHIWRLEVADKDPIAEALLLSLFKSGMNIYAHSLFGLQTRSVRRLISARAGALLLDLHGSVPEEFSMYGDGFGAQVYNEYEHEVAGKIDYLVAVSRNMSRHFAKKHNYPEERIIVCPIFVEAGARASHRRYNDRPRVIYAGGTQKWQQIDKMVDLVKEGGGRSDYLFLTPDPETLLEKFKKAGLDAEADSFAVRSAKHAEVIASYARFDFGLLLREDSIVNRVACPTKLIEYLTFGVIPILDTEYVGDFVDLGMRYVRLVDYRAGNIPDRSERRRMAEANWAVVDRLQQWMTDGGRRIATLMIDVAPRQMASVA